MRGTERVPLAVGDAVYNTDLIVTRRGRVRVTVEGKGEITVYDDTRVALEDYGLRHELGGLLIEVQDAFRVQYAQTTASVEGTRFRVEGAESGAGVVIVEEGLVRVTSPDGEVLVAAGEQAAIQPGQALVKEGANARGRAPQQRRYYPFSIGPQLGGGLNNHIGLAGGTGAIRADVLGRLRLPGPFAVSMTGGLVNSTTTSHFPVTTSFEFWLGPVGFGAAGDLMLGVKESCDPPSRTLVVSGAGHVTANVSIPVRPRWLFDARLMAGWSAGPQVFATAGMSFRP